MHLYREIHEQPGVIQGLLHGQAEPSRVVAQAIKAFAPDFIVIAARGTSDNAARYAQYLFGHYLGLFTALATPSLHTIYDTPPDLSHALTIGISQSGQAEDVRQVLEDARRQGGLTLAITNYDDSPMAQTAAHHLNLMAGEEHSIAATKTYTAQLTVLAMLVAALVDDSELQDGLAQLPRHLQHTLDANASIEAWAQRYRYMQQFAVIGRGFNFATAFEISLKVKELAYIASEGYSEADFRHGPIAIVQSGFPTMVVAPRGAVMPKMRDLLEKLGNKSAERLVITNDESLAKLAHRLIRIPDMPEWLSPIVSVVPGQLFAMQQALIRGYAVDNPRGLSKVTVTE